MSSSVTRSPVMSSPTTLSAEKRREMSGEMLASPGLIDFVKQVHGTITEVHDSLAFIKAYDASNGNAIASGDWISLIHSTEEIVERFGTIRTGMGVLVTTNGLDGSQSIAQIISNEHQKVGEEIIPNTIDLGLWEIFTPGSGL